MVEKVEGIVLRSIKYSDNSLIIHLFTRERGRISCMVKKVRSKNSGFAPSFFHPFNFILAEIFYNPRKEIHTIKEVSLKHSLPNFNLDPGRLAIIMFLSEVMNKAIRYQHTDEHLYDFIVSSVTRFHQEQQPSSNFHIYFLLELTKYLGFYPLNNFSNTEKIFDLLNAQFVAESSGSQTLDIEVSSVLNKFLALPSGNWWEIPLSGSTRRKSIESLLNFYTLHTGIQMDTKSLDIFAEIFN